MDGQGARVDRFGYAPGAVAGALSLQHRRAEPRGHERQSGTGRRPAARRSLCRCHGAPALQHRARPGAADHAQRPDNAPIPMGANVLDAAGNSVGMVGQANQVYLRSDKRAGELTLNWGDAPASSARCITACLPGKTARFNGSAPRAASPLNLFSGETMKRIFTRSPPWRCSPCRCSARPPRWRNAPGSPPDRFRLRSLRGGHGAGQG